MYGGPALFGLFFGAGDVCMRVTEGKDDKVFLEVTDSAQSKNGKPRNQE